MKLILWTSAKGLEDFRKGLTISAHCGQDKFVDEYAVKIIVPADAARYLGFGEFEVLPRDKW